MAPGMAELSTPESKAAGYKYLTGGFSNTLVTGGETSQQSVNGSTPVLLLP